VERADAVGEFDRLLRQYRDLKESLPSVQARGDSCADIRRQLARLEADITTVGRKLPSFYLERFRSTYQYGRR